MIGVCVFWGGRDQFSSTALLSRLYLLKGPSLCPPPLKALPCDVSKAKYFVDGSGEGGHSSRHVPPSLSIRALSIALRASRPAKSLRGGGTCMRDVARRLQMHCK